MKLDMINLMFCGNDKVLDGMIIALLSITKYNKQPINLYVLTVDLQHIKTDYKPLTNKHIEILDNILKSANKESKVTLIDITDMFTEEILNSVNIKTHYTPYIFLRLFADKIDVLPDKILYLDVDIVCYKDIAELYNIDIEEYHFAAALDYYGKFFINKNYLNSGVLLLNLKKIREENLFEKCRKMCMTKRMLLPDQSALNKICKKKLILPNKYNEQHSRTDETVIRHFSMIMKFFPRFKLINIKPWHIENMHNIYKIFDFDDIIDKYNNIKQNIIEE
jgi:lipopolysaccharide biosynthesis glycosyltransferase